MHIIYLDESGAHSEAHYLVVAGLAVFERETYFLARSLDQLQSRYFPEFAGPLPFHAADLRAPPERLKPPYDGLTPEQRRSLIADIYGVIADSKARLFAVAVEKAGADMDDPYERGFEEIVNRFDRMLARMLRDRGEPQRGLIVMADSEYRAKLQLLARRIWAEGHRWGETRNMADVPYFAPAGSTRLLQLADFVANAVYGRYEKGLSRNFDQIALRFDQDGGRIHGLVHLARDRQNCYCPACVTRRLGPRSDPDQLSLPDS